MCQKLTLMIIGLVLVGSVVMAESPTTTRPSLSAEPWVALGQPGDYTVNSLNSDSQVILRSYKVTGIAAKNRGNLDMALRELLGNDGARGGRVQVGNLHQEDGKDVVLVVVSATERMQESVQRVIDQINAGQIDFLAHCPGTAIYFPKYRSAQAIADAIKPELTLMGLTHVDPVLNALTIEDYPAYVEWLVSDIAEKYDLPVPRVIAKVTIVKINENNDRKVGLDWNAWANALPPSVSANLFGERFVLNRSQSLELGADGRELAGSNSRDGLSSLKFNFATTVEGISPQALQAFVNYLSMKGNCEVVTQANIVVMNETPAEIKSEVAIAVPATVSTETGGKIRTEVPVVEGLRVLIKGLLFQNGQKFEIQATRTSIVGFSQNGLPMVSTSSINTAAGFLFGRTVVFSGLTEVKKETVTNGPGWDVLRLLSTKQSVDSKSLFYICVTAEKGDGQTPDFPTTSPVN